MKRSRRIEVQSLSEGYPKRVYLIRAPASFFSGIARKSISTLKRPEASKRSNKMDVIYDVVESIHIFIPLVAIVFICIVLYINGKKDIEDTDALVAGSRKAVTNKENGNVSKTEEEKKCD